MVFTTPYREINAFIYDATVLEYLATHDEYCKLRTVGNWYAMTGYGVGFPRGSKWIDRFNKYMTQFQHDGKIYRNACIFMASLFLLVLNSCLIVKYQIPFH